MTQVVVLEKHTAVLNWTTCNTLFIIQEINQGNNEFSTIYSNQIPTSGQIMRQRRDSIYRDINISISIRYIYIYIYIL